MQYAVCDAYYGGTLLPGGAGLAIKAGSVTDVNKPGIRRTLDLELVPVPGLFDQLKPFGTQLKVRSVMRYPNGTTENIPMGVFDIDSESMSYGPGGTITVQGSDKWAKIQRARFIVPEPAIPGIYIRDQIATLIRGALGNAEPVTIRNNDGTKTGAWYWERDRDATIIQLAEVVGAQVFFDRNGVATIASAPKPTAAAVWLVDSSSSGVLLSADRSRDRGSAYNVVVVSSEMTDGTELFAPQIVWDNDSSSPTYAGPDPFGNPGAAGPFGVVPYFYSSPFIRTATSAQGTGINFLNQVTGLQSQLSLTAVRNHALDAGDVIDVLLTRERYDLPRVVEHHVIDKIVHPLTPDGVQQMETRAFRTDAFT